MKRKPRPKRSPKPSFRSTNIDVCGVVIDTSPVIICTLQPGHLETAAIRHGSVAMTSDGVFCVVTQTEGEVEWSVVEDAVSE